MGHTTSSHRTQSREFAGPSLAESSQSEGYRFSMDRTRARHPPEFRE